MKTRAHSTTPAKEIAYLKAAGWTFVDKMWMDPRKDASYHKRMGGYCDPDNAVADQRAYDRFDKGLPTYAVCRARDTYGYLLRRCDGLDKPYVTVCRHHDEDMLKTAATRLNKQTDAAMLQSDEEMYARTIDAYTYPYLLLCEEKHGTFRFYVPTRAAFHAACLSVVKRRNGEGYWYTYDQSEQPTVPVLSKEAVIALADSRTKTTALEEWAYYERRLKELSNEKAEVVLLAKALAGDGEAAADFLKARAKNEYEGFKLVTLDSPDAEDA